MAGHACTRASWLPANHEEDAVACHMSRRGYLSSLLAPATREGRQGIAAVPQAKEDCPTAQAGGGHTAPGISVTLWRSATGSRFLTPSRMCPKRKKNAQLLSTTRTDGVSVPDMGRAQVSAGTCGTAHGSTECIASTQRIRTVLPLLRTRSELCHARPSCQQVTAQHWHFALSVCTPFMRELGSGKGCRETRTWPLLQVRYRKVA